MSMFAADGVTVKMSSSFSSQPTLSFTQTSNTPGSLTIAQPSSFSASGSYSKIRQSARYFHSFTMYVYVRMRSEFLRADKH